MIRNGDLVLLSLLGLAIGAALLRDPSRVGRCRTLAEHLVNHSARGLSGVLRV